MRRKRRGRRNGERASPRELTLVMFCLLQQKKWTKGELGEFFGVSERQVKRHLRLFDSFGILRRNSPPPLAGKAAPWRYSLEPGCATVIALGRP